MILNSKFIEETHWDYLIVMIIHIYSHIFFLPGTRSRRYQEEVARIHRELYKKDLHDPGNHDGVITDRHPGMWSQVGLRKHHYEQS